MGIASCKNGEAVRGYCRLVKADISQHLAVGTELQSTVEREFFFIYPVGNTVQNGITFAVFCNLAFAVSVEKLHKIDIIIPYKCNHCSVR